MDAERDSVHPRQYRTEVRQDLVCLMCARAILDPRVWPPVPASIRVDAPDPFLLQQRCATCGGQPMPGETFNVRVFTGPEPDWEAERPRRGRPPNRLRALIRNRLNA